MAFFTVSVAAVQRQSLSKMPKIQHWDMIGKTMGMEPQHVAEKVVERSIHMI